MLRKISQKSSRFEKFFFGCFNVSHAEILEHGQLHGIQPIVELFNVDKTQTTGKTEMK
jgi:hypothetical protein